MDDLPPTPSSPSSTNQLDLRLVVETPLRQFAPWLVVVLLVTWDGYPGIICVTPLAWVLALRVGILCVTHSASSSRTRRLQEAALAGAWLGFLQGVLFAVIVPRMGEIRASEQIAVTLLNLGIIVIGMLAGAALSIFTGYLVERRQ